MKNHIFRLSALVLALVMLLTMFAGCNKPDGTIENGGSTDNSTTAVPIQITTTIHEIAKHGNLVLYMYGADLFDKGFAHGDMVEIAIGEKTWDVPLCTSYSDVDNGEVVLRATGETDGVVLAINMGDFATTAGIAQKSAIEEEPGYRWDYLMEEPVQITITLKEEDGYREQWLIRQLVRTNERADYAHLSDEAFWDIMEITDAPIIASHSNSRSFHGMSRNLTDDMFRAICQTGGVAGFNMYADFVGPNPNMDTVCDHILHLLRLDPECRHLALGGDLDGCSELPSGFEGIQSYPALAEQLLRRGLTEQNVQDLFFNNAMGVMRACCM